MIAEDGGSRPSLIDKFDPAVQAKVHENKDTLGDIIPLNSRGQSWSTKARFKFSAVDEDLKEYLKADVDALIAMVDKAKAANIAAAGADSSPIEVDVEDDDDLGSQRAPPQNIEITRSLGYSRDAASIRSLSLPLTPNENRLTRIQLGHCFLDKEKKH